LPKLGRKTGFGFGQKKMLLLATLKNILIFFSDDSAEKKLKILFLKQKQTQKQDPRNLSCAIRIKDIDYIRITFLFIFSEKIV
jgi:hypothetical protein